jgi:hypothetical protein
VAEIGQAGARHQPDIAAANHRDMHQAIPASTILFLEAAVSRRAAPLVRMREIQELGDYFKSQTISH